MKIKIDEKGKLFVDDIEKKISEVNSDFLEMIVEKGLNEDVEYEFKQDESNPIVALFESLKKLTLPESDFKKELARIEKMKEDKQKQLELLENQTKEESN